MERYAPAERLIQLCLALTETRGGLTVAEMAEELGVTRRTIERLRGALERTVGRNLEFRLTDQGLKRWYLPGPPVRAFAAPTFDELAALRALALDLRKQGQEENERLLNGAILKLEAALPRSTLRRFEPDLETLLEATGVVVRPGPRAVPNVEIMRTLRRALLASQQVRLTYDRRDGGGVSRPRLHPYGLLFSARGHLVGFNTHPKVREYRLYALSHIRGVELLDWTFTRDPNFDLQIFSERSFGVFREDEVWDVAWRFKSDVANDVSSFHFHATQQIKQEPNGSVVVSFRASGLTEMAWHLFTWGENVEVIRPKALKKLYRDLLLSAMNTATRESPLENNGG